MKVSSRDSALSMINFFNFLGKSIIDLANNLGAATIFFNKSVLMIFRPKQLPEIVQQVYHIGARSSAIVMLVGLFAGIVLGPQPDFAFAKFGSEGVLSSVIALIRELGPVLAAIMIAARAGSAMAAEIGMQRISEQIDALYTMQIDPIECLISPRIAASIISFPLPFFWRRQENPDTSLPFLISWTGWNKTGFSEVQKSSRSKCCINLEERR